MVHTLVVLMWRDTIFAFSKWTLLICFLIHSVIATPNPLQVGPTWCDKGLFGVPKVEDCNQAFLWMPKKNPNADAQRVFAEPQFLNPPFNSVKNPNAPRAIIQLPKIFKYGESMGINSYSKSFSFLRLYCRIMASATLTSDDFFQGRAT